jgi:demethylmenaquinone methyltransferase/2-methoxy-6-polyprenyl-1,4-benzoquinol methylase
VNFQLPTKDAKADYVLKQFDRIAKKYDLANDLISLGMHRLWKARAIYELVGASACFSCTGCSGTENASAGSTPGNTSAATHAAHEQNNKSANCPGESRSPFEKNANCAGDSGSPFEKSSQPSAATAAACTAADPAVASAMEMIEQALKNKGPRKYLDVCTGTGDLALEMYGRLGGYGEVCGLDFSPEMLAVARQRCARAFGDTPKLQWVQGDAQNLPFEDNSFDGAIISFGLRNLTDLQKGLNEMARVVKPGGRVVNLDLGQPDMPVFTPLFLFFFDKIVPIIGELIQNDRQAYTYLPESRKSYPHPVRLSEMFAEAGLVDISCYPLALGSVALHAGTVK